MYRKNTSGLAALLLLLVNSPGVGSMAFAQATPAMQALSKMRSAAGTGLRVSQSGPSGLATFVAAEPGHGIPVAAARSTSAEVRARSFLGANGPAFGIHALEEVSVTRTSKPDEVGIEHVRMQQWQKGIPVRGGEITVHLRGNSVTAVNSHVIADVDRVSLVPTTTADQATEIARRMVEKELNLPQVMLTEPHLEILNPGQFADRVSSSHLTWFIEATAFGVREFIWVDAQSDDVLLHFSQIAKSRNRSVYTANNSDSLPGTFLRSEGQGPVGDSDADLAYTFAGDTYDYYLGQHGRDSYNGSGASLVSTVHYCEPGSCPYPNAFWDGSQMVYGEGFSAADDVDAHELTHAVTESSANLNYCLQAGALNESFSDIFGETVDLTNVGGTDTAAVRWQIGEDIPGIGAIRDMLNPSTFNDPERVSDSNFRCYTTCTDSNDSGGVHTNSGVPNHAYALMVDGGSYNGFTISGIGLTKAGKVQYRALTHYLTSNAKFKDDYNALQTACADLIGTAGITASDCTEVKNALDAVELGAAVCPVCGDGTTGGSEECDDGNSVNGDGCDNNCTITACGNGILTSGELCDDGNLTSDDGCESDCTVSVGCELAWSNDTPLAIPDQGTATSSVSLSNASAAQSVVVMGLRGTHTFLGDLRFTLTSPANTEVLILDRVCSGNDNFSLSLSDAATSLVTCPATDGGAHLPSNPLAAFAGDPASGTWTLTIADQAPVDSGTLQGWGLLVCGNCGNGTVDSGEDCDDGNIAPGDGCSSSCKVESCAEVAKSNLKITNLGTLAADDSLTVKGDIVLPFPINPALRPDLKGLRLVIRNSSGAVVADVKAPPGAYNTTSKQGWKSLALGSKWKFLSTSAAGGISQAQLIDKSARSPGLVKLMIKGKHGSFSVSDADLPLEGTVVLDSSSQCAAVAFPAPTSGCSFDSRTVKCR